MLEEWKKIKALAFDVDGVLTNGGILAVTAEPNGDLYRVFDAKDAFAMRMAAMHGYRLAIITGGTSISLTQRFKYCGFDEENIYLDSRDKIKDFRLFCEKNGLSAHEVMYFGDDLPDIPVLKACGIGACPNDAVSEVKEIADYVSPNAGGHLFVRETIERLMKLKGEWNLDVAQYERMF